MCSANVIRKGCQYARAPTAIIRLRVLGYGKYDDIVVGRCLMLPMHGESRVLEVVKWLGTSRCTLLLRGRQPTVI